MMVNCVSGDRARLALNLDMPDFGKTCTMRFWTHMYGNDIERLNILSRTMIGGPEKVEKSFTAQSTVWTLQEVTFRNSQPIQVTVI